MVTTPSDIPEIPGAISNSKDIDLTSTLHISSLRSVSDSPSDNSLLDALSSEEFNILKDLTRDCAMFISLAGPGKGARFLLNSDCVTIGRESSSEIFLDDVTVSRKHCQVLRTRSGSSTTFEIEDLKSLNGTYVNAISKVKTSLNHGDEVQVGKYRLTFFSPVSGQRTNEIQ
ncbi:MAG: FHA domain-containing protein [Actinomycetales bacterium]|nr:MAG: FHA domain-containing protein [Actinomycetales bacterium]